MKKVISIVVVLVVGGILFWLDSSNNNINLAKGKFSVNDANSPISSSTAPEVQPAQAIESNQATTEALPLAQSTQTDFQLQPHEITIVQEWADERGYDFEWIQISPDSFEHEKCLMSLPIISLAFWILPSCD